MGRAGWFSAGRTRRRYVSAFGQSVSLIITTKPPQPPAPSVIECTQGRAECSGQWVSESHHHLVVPCPTSPSPKGSGNPLMTNKTPQGGCTVSSTMSSTMFFPVLQHNCWSPAFPSFSRAWCPLSQK